MTKTAFIFPGQGGQFVGQGLKLAEKNPSARAIFEKTDQLTGLSISNLCFNGPIEELSRTENLQPAILAVSLSAALALTSQDLKPDFVAGHSLGEFGALAIANVLSQDEAIKLVAQRAALMQQATEGSSGAMAAVIGLTPDELEGICELARNEGLVVSANFNTPEQTVISGEARAVAAAGKFIKIKSGRFIPLPVSGAFHSPLMALAAQKFNEELEKITFKTPICPVIPNALGEPVSDPVKIKKFLIDQMTSPVYWTKTVNSLVKGGVKKFAECWPKNYLGSMVKKCLPPEEGFEIFFAI